MELNPGTCFKNFYWMEGPLPGDTGSRITVLHSGQEQQCSHCLKTGREGCRAFGNGKACQELGTPRAKMLDYMTYLKKMTGYESLKSQYHKQYPLLGKINDCVMEDDCENEDIDHAIIPLNPIEQRDAKIAELEKNAAEVPDLKEKLLKMKAELSLAVKTSTKTKNKLKFARKVTEERLKECLPVPTFEEEHSKVLITLMSALIDEENFDNDPDSEKLIPKSDFLKDVEESIGCDANEEVVRQRLSFVKNKLVERVMQSPARRRLSLCSVNSVNSTKSNDKKRKSSAEAHGSSEAVQRSKPSLIPTMH